jgi:regulatory protein
LTIGGGMKRQPLSLQARAVSWLAQREHSRNELRRKLLRLALQPAAEDATEAVDEDAAAAQVESLLDTLQAQGLLCEQRFVAGRVRARASGQGSLRIQLELARHGLKLAAQPLQQLRDSEPQRAALLWQRRFGKAPADARERARQMRFLAGRGFSAEAIRYALGAANAPPDDDPPAD